VRFSRSDRLIARASPAGFAHISSRGMYVPFQHLLALDEQLSALCLGELDRLIVSMPPRHGKSETISRYLPAWYLGRFPDRRVMLCSYEASFAASWGRKARELVEEFGDELFGVRVSETSSSASAWEIERHAGGMVTAGVGGPLTGKGAHLLVMDDPIKNAEEAASELMREKAWEWWRSTARTRLQRPGKVVLVMTRWHEDDLAGRLLGAMAEDPAADQWRLLELPALAEEGDPLGRPPGEPLCPELGFDGDWAKRTRASSGSYWWSALYQQRPSPPEGMLFKQRDFRYWHPDSDAELFVLETDTGPKPIGRAWCTIFQTVDPAASEKDTADYTVVCTWAATPDRELLLLDRQRERFETLEVTGLIRRAHQRWNPSFIGIESFGHGLGVIQELSREGLPIRELRSDKDKIARALVAVARYEQHLVYHPRGPGCDWVKQQWEPELLAFPNAAHDDQVDTVGYAARELPNLGGTRRPRPRFGGTTIMGGIRDRPL
jgi:predicted phage terminase large subunit-like protein